LDESPTSLADFSLNSLPVKGRFLVLGSANDEFAPWSRSLNIEHVSAAELVWQEITRRSPLGQSAEAAVRRGEPWPDAVTLAVLRRWFWACRPDAGFILTDFPATLLQATVFDEWIETRNSSLTAVIVTDPAPAASALINYYRTTGVPLVEVPAHAAA
jgi:adenylate kinase